MKRLKVLFDTDIILDALQKREPWKNNAEKLILAVTDEKIEGYLTTKQLCDIWYLAYHIHKGEKDVSRRSQMYISKLCDIFIILDTTSEDIITALSYDAGDFEDGVMRATAERTKMDIIVTHNNKENAPSKVRVVHLDEFIKNEFE